jgi:hypothetical protein
MNALRNFNPRLYEILEIEHRLMSKAHLSKELSKWLNKNNYVKNAIIYVDEKINELSGLPNKTKHNELDDGWWDFVTLVYKKWVIRYNL